jgi:hypothetical protein
MSEGAAEDGLPFYLGSQSVVIVVFSFEFSAFLPACKQAGCAC